MLRGLFKKAYYFFLGPLYNRVTAEREQAIHEANQKIEHLTKEVGKLTKSNERLTRKVERFKEQMLRMEDDIRRFKILSIEHEGRVTVQVQDEFVKMYELIESIKADREDVKLNVTLVNELVKIHQSIEAVKYENLAKLGEEKLNGKV
jgi:hypothetical protein